MSAGEASNALPPVVAEAVETVGVGGTTEVLRSPTGFLILEVRDRREQAEVIVREFQARHLMIRPNELITNEQAEQRIRDLHQQLMDGASFDDLAREHFHGRDLGQYRGLARLVLGGHLRGSDPGRNQSVSTRVKPASRSRLRSAGIFCAWRVSARLIEPSRPSVPKPVTLLFRQKAEEEVDRFLRRLRDESFVEIRL